MSSDECLSLVAQLVRGQVGKESGKESFMSEAVSSPVKYCRSDWGFDFRYGRSAVTQHLLRIFDTIESVPREVGSRCQEWINGEKPDVVEEEEAVTEEPPQHNGSPRRQMT